MVSAAQNWAEALPEQDLAALVLSGQSQVRQGALAEDLAAVLVSGQNQRERALVRQEALVRPLALAVYLVWVGQGLWRWVRDSVGTRWAWFSKYQCFNRSQNHLGPVHLNRQHRIITTAELQRRHRMPRRGLNFRAEAAIS